MTNLSEEQSSEEVHFAIIDGCTAETANVPISEGDFRDPVARPHPRPLVPW